MRNLLICLFIGFSTIYHAQEKTEVITSCSIFADMATNLGGEKVNVVTLVPVGADPHIYEATPGDAIKVKKAEVLLVNGLNFEGWIEELIDNSGTKGKKHIITDGVKAIASSDYDNSYDPHAWMSASNGIVYCTNILAALIEAAPENKEYFESNFSRYKKELVELGSYIQKEIASIPKAQRLLITSHDAFAYYGQEYGLKLEAIQGISTDADVRTSDISRVTKMIKESKVPSIFIESTINPKLIKQLAEDNGVSIGGELFADSLGKKATEEGTYIGMLKHNTDIIVNALKGGQKSKTIIDEDQGPKSSLMYIILGVVLLLIVLGLIFKMNQ